MTKSTPERRARTWISSVLDRLDRSAFREPDLRATAHGWQVRRERRFRRIYRDPRWDTVSECPTCHGSGHDRAQPCGTCAGAGTVRQEAAAHQGSTRPAGGR
jgi:hypothetical protein